MSGSNTNSGIRDNHTRGIVADFLKAKIQPGSRLSVVSAYFTIYAYEALKEHLDQIGHLDFLFGEPSSVTRLDPAKNACEKPLYPGSSRCTIKLIIDIWIIASLLLGSDS